MKGFVAFCRKEWLEGLRTYRLWIMMAVFAALGILSPLFAKLLPDLLSGTDIGGGVTLQMPPATAFDSWTQFFKNVSQLGSLVLIIVFCGITATEFSRGTLVNVLTKGLRRSTIVVAKLAVAALIWTISYLVSLGIAFGYTLYFWGDGTLQNAGLAFVSPWLFGLFLLALMILGGIVGGNIYGSLLAAGGMIIALNIVAIVPKSARFNPLSLAGGTLGLLDGQNQPRDFVPALLICVAAIVVTLAASLLVIDRKQL